VDKANKDDDSESIQNQKLLLMDYAVANGFLIHNIYVDEDLSGFSDRPAFRQMIKDAAGGLFDTIICKSQSRFTRDLELVERYIHGYFVEWGVRFIGVTDNVDTNVKGNKKARQIYGLINQWYSEDLSENIRAVFRKKMQAGQFLGAFACYGYTKCPTNRHRLVIDDTAAGIVREIFALYLQGHGAHSIAHILSERGVPTPSRHKVDSGLNYANPGGGVYDGLWSASTINRILRNEAYVGTLIQGRERRVSYKSKKVAIAPKGDWVVIKDNHAPIIDEATFRKVQGLMSRRRKSGGIDKPGVVKPHVLAGKLRCADCGHAMQRSGVSRDGNTHYVRCGLAAKTKRRDCTPHCTSQGKIEEAILHGIRGLVRDAVNSHGADGIIEAVQGQISKKGDGSIKIQKQLMDMDAKIKAIQTNIAMAYADKLGGTISQEDFLSFREVFGQERQGYVNKREYLEEELRRMSTQSQTHDDIAALLNTYMGTDTLTHEIINDFVDTIHIGEKDPVTNEQIITIKWIL